jgi:alpha-glucoside transport system substrate-binding protein
MLNRKLLMTVVLLSMLAMLFVACGGAGTPTPTQPAQTGVDEPVVDEPVVEEPVVEEPEGDLAGSVVTIFTAAGEEQLRVFEQNFVDFEQRTGIDVQFEGSPDFETLALVRAEGGDSPDILNFPQPGLMGSMARDGYLIPLDFVADQAQQNYSQSWIDLGTVDGTLYGVWHGADVKSLVWYPKAAFEEAGYEVPQTWDELLALSDQIVADGGVPWCVAIESGGATGWPATDWIEDVMLRTASPEDYDAWVAGELPFSSDQVRNAFETVGEIWFNPDYVLGGTTGILTTNFGDGPTPLFEDPPGCWLHRQASFIPNFFPEDAEVGVDVDYFYLPPINEADFGRPVLGSGNLVSLGRDTPAGRAVIEFMTTPESVEAEVRNGLVVAPMNGVPDDWYPSDTMRGFAEILRNADTFRFDGSDLMPGVVGAGTFWSGAVNWVSGQDLDSVLAEIDASWP